VKRMVTTSGKIMITALMREGETMDDLISRQAAIDVVHRAIYDFFDICSDDDESPITYKDEKLLEINKAITAQICKLPSAQPEITLESAIDYLHSIGWMQEHDGILTESAQPEIIRCKDCKHTLKENNGALVCCLTKMVGTTDPNWFCADGERKEQ